MAERRSILKSVLSSDPGKARKFGERLKGRLILPADEAYESARWSWNRAVDRRPGIIVRCADRNDVVRAVGFARDNDLLLAVRSGGHSFAGLSTCDDGMIIDLSAMKEIHIDPRKRIASAQAGVKVGEFDRATHGHSLATVMGGCEEVGIAGFTLGGGQGLLSGRYGLGCDNLIAVEVVTADGRLLHASADAHSDLFWGMRGGAGNFGIATQFEYRLHPVIAIYGGTVVYQIEQARQVLRAWREYITDPPDELTTYLGITLLPDGPAIGIVACYCGDLDEGAKVLRPLESFGSPIVNSLGQMSYLDLQHSMEETNPSDVFAFCRSNFFPELNDQLIDIIAQHIAIAPGLFFVGMFPYRGAVCHKHFDDTACPTRAHGYEIAVHSWWRQPSDTSAAVQWADRFWSALRPFSSGAVYVNNLSDEGEERAKAAYGANYDRLVALKNEYDPTNFFRMNQNIKPTAPSSP
jgi:FAD/FMN-containing dehydrogenase